ncbi:D-alanyl-D-alanine carboxypeptidase family protein [Thiocystis violascens]|uniref:serine-type D-Ala-D-Ala carboxypeptidase n=1 Tax=Thiocystis violascens (strain ATCC 17096 / DSM 198 / 6111) TaxID=765911 RepID=I3YFA7_THIV6|nr:D-alanyl-D-alanine carboxypeptidase family protein [Thiocystis violascens]AFL75675.1 penicillin-binding protein 6 [Thiocystis violascens DSM 198]
MKSASPILFLWLILCALPLSPASAQPPIPAPPELAAKGYLLVDFNSGKTLIEQNADERLEPASLTKIMTAYVVFRELAGGKIKLTDQVMISEKAWRTGGSKMFIEVGKQVGLEDLLKGMIIQSGNDASVALAEHTAGSIDAFANLMNDHARRLGMADSHFTNPNGLPDPDLYTTARDMARVTLALIREFPEYYAWYSNREFVYNNITQQNRNPLLARDASADGVKTGYTKAAGYCLVGSAKREDMRLISVVMGSATPKARAEASLALLNYGFRFYESHRLYPANQPIESIRVWYGDLENLPVGPATDVFATIPRGVYDKLGARLEKTSDFIAPIALGAQVGDIIVTLDEAEIARVPLVALQEVAEGNLWRKFVDSILKLVDSLLH